MASAEENTDEVTGRRTRSGRKVSASQSAQPTPATRSRRSTRKQIHEELTEHETTEISNEVSPSETNNSKSSKHNSIFAEQDSEILNEMMAEATQGIVAGGCNDSPESHNNLYEVVEEEVAQDNDCIVYKGNTEVRRQHEDVQMYTVHDDEPNESEVPATMDGGLDEKSSSFPFGTIGHSETSEDVQNEEEVSCGGTNEGVTVESSLLASLAGDNANSLPSVGGGEDNECKKDFETKVNQTIGENCDKMDSTDESVSQPAIAEDLADGDTSNATIVNTELVSEDELLLPIPTKPKISYAEEVSDDELPAPKRAELPADAEVISEDELPPRKSPGTSPKRGRSAVKINIYTTSTDINNSANHKRKAEDGGTPEYPEKVVVDKANKSDCKKIKSDEQYNPMSPTSESDDSPPVEKKAKIESSGDSEQKEKKRDKDKEREKEKEKERDRDRDREREKEKDKEKDKEKEKKKLPDLEKYWRAVKEDPADFTGWTYLLQYVDNESDAEAAREAYDAFLSHYPYCYGYWRKYADYEKRKGIKANCNAVFERGLEAIPLSVDLWIHYLSHVKSNHTDNADYIRSQFERAVAACGLEFRSDKLWDAYIKWENDGKRYQRVLQIYDRLLAIPTQGYSGHFDNFQDFINQHSVTSIVSNEELKKIRTEIRETSSSSRSSSSRSKSRHASKEKEREHHRDEKKEEASHDSTSQKEFEHNDVRALEVSETSRDSGSKVHHQHDLSDISTITEEELSSIKDKVISIRRKVHKTTVAAVTARWSFEEGIKRPYFHVKPLERCQLKNWKDYLDFEIEKGDQKRVLVLFERCLIACALYDEFWLKMLRYLETQVGQPGIAATTSDVYRRACQIHHPDKPSLHLMWAAYEECQNNFDQAAKVLLNLESKCPNLLQVAYRRINVERRRGDIAKCRELYEHYISTAKNKTISGSLAIKYARFLNKICSDLDGGLKVLRQALEKDSANTRVALQMIDLALQRPVVDEGEVVSIMDKFMARDNMDPEQKVLFAQRKVEFLEDFGSTAKGLQDAQRALQLALNKANEAKKKRESSPSRQATFNNGSAAANNNYYGSTNSAYYGQNSGAYQQQQQQHQQQQQQQQQQQSYDGYYNHWQYGSGGYSGYGQWSGYGNYY